MSDTPTRFFSWSDAWVFASILLTHRNGDHIDLARILDAGDWLNHSVLTLEELQRAFRNLQKLGLIKISGRTIKISNRVNLQTYSSVDKCLDRMNAISATYRAIKNVDRCRFLTEDALDEAYRRYTHKTPGKNS